MKQCRLSQGIVTAITIVLCFSPEMTREGLGSPKKNVAEVRGTSMTRIDARGSPDRLRHVRKA